MVGSQRVVGIGWSDASPRELPLSLLSGLYCAWPYVLLLGKQVLQSLNFLHLLSDCSTQTIVFLRLPVNCSKKMLVCLLLLSQ
mmetsp:Transcript_50356/g.89997  ORF Transcript_50356/g.89997 Transcript_50356/m.89997 type:complete len:83 (-) Transcript_50356:287-535(-)